jgi:glutathione S-transferase
MALKLYNHHLSPYATRVRIMAYAKNIPLEFLSAPGGGWKSPEFLAINPVGKIPTLIDGNHMVPESETICEYLEDKYPTPSLRLDTPEKRSQVRAITRLLDSYVLVPVQTILAQNIKAHPDMAVVDEYLAIAGKGFSYIEHFFEGPRYAVGGKLTQADCALVPWLAYFEKLLPKTLNRPVILSPKLRSYFNDIIANDPAVGKAMGEMLPQVELRIDGIFKIREAGGAAH